MKKNLLSLFIFVTPVILHAQDSLKYMPARESAANGDVMGGRAMIDSVLGTVEPSSTEYAEGLYWRASLAETTQNAERDYRRIVVDYPLSSRVEDVLLKLSQIEMARGDKDVALQHLQRLALEYPNGGTRAQGSYLMAQILLDRNDMRNGCAAISDAFARASANNIELRNQIGYLMQRCLQAVATPVTPLGADENPQPIPTITDSSKTLVSAPGNFSIQVGAFTKKSQANELVAKLRSRGYQARVDGKKSPFRVRIGKYATRADAAAALGRMKEKKMNGFVVSE